MKTSVTLIILFFFPLLSHSGDWKFVAELGHGGRIVDIAAPDSNNCYVLDQWTDTNFIYKTTNQGKTVFPIHVKYVFDDELPNIVNADKFAVPFPAYLYVVFHEQGIIKKSTDDGATFERIKIGDSTLYEISMIDTNKGVLLSSYGAYSFIYVTKDGWNSFKKLDTAFWGMLISPTNYNANNIQILQITKNSELILNYNSYNDSLSVIYDFNLDTTQIYHDLFKKLIYINEKVGFLAGHHRNGVGEQSADIIYKTKDGGRSWAKVYDKENFPIFGLQDIAFYDEYNGVAVGAGNKTLMTNDGGYTWVYECPEIMNRGYDSVYGSLVSHVAWIGRTPVIGTFGGNFYRYEGNFFIFDQKVAAPKLKSPENNAVVQNIGGMLTWQPYSTDYLYIVELARDSNFIDTVLTRIKYPFGQKPNSLNYELLEYFTTYYWRVGYIRTKPSDTVWSDVYHFRTRISGNKTTAPKCGILNQHTNVVLSWEPVMGADKYRIQFGRDADLGFGAELFDSLTAANFEVKNLDSGTYYYWRVQAFNFGEENEWAPVCFFKTVESKLDVRESIPGGGLNINQTGDEITISLDADIICDLNLEIIDFSGNTIYENILNSTQTIDLSRNASGIYFYKISHNGEIITTGKFTVVR